jgi:hypothetical protein
MGKSHGGSLGRVVALGVVLAVLVAGAPLPAEGRTSAAAPPAVTSVSPNTGPLAGGTKVTITGSRFAKVKAVTFGTKSVPFLVKSRTRIVATAPKSASVGTVPVRVRTAAGSSALTKSSRFTYLPIPRVTKVAPAAGPTSGGNVVTITGSGFTRTNQVTFGSKLAKFTVASDKKITVAAPPGTPGRVQVRVRTPGGRSAAVRASTYRYAAAPTVTGLSPTSGESAGGTVVTITGTGFTDAIEVTVGGVSVTELDVAGDTQITLLTPASAAGPATVNVRVTTPFGQSDPNAASTYTYLASPPTVTGLAPTQGPIAGGNSVTILGTNFTGATQVQFGTTNALFVVSNPTQIIATAPPGTAGGVQVRVTTPGGQSDPNAASTYTYLAPPTVTGLSPVFGPTAGGTAVTISGANLSGATSVTFGAANAGGFTVDNPGQITVIAPPGQFGRLPVQVTTPGGTSTIGPASQFGYCNAVSGNEVPGSATNLGSVFPGGGITTNGHRCPNNDDWFRVVAQPASATCLPGQQKLYRATVTLTPGFLEDLDLFVRLDSPTGPELSSRNGGTMPETIQVNWNEICGSSTPKDLYIGVVGFPAAAMNLYQLQLSHQFLGVS